MQKRLLGLSGAEDDADLLMSGHQPQRQLTIFADVAVNEVLQHKRHDAPFMAEGGTIFPAR